MALDAARATIVVFVLNLLYLHQLSYALLDYLAFLPHAQAFQFFVCEAQLLIHMRSIPSSGLQIDLSHLVVPVFFMWLIGGRESFDLLEGRSLLQFLIRHAPASLETVSLAQALGLKIDGLCVVATVADLPLHKQLVRSRHIS